MQEAQAINLFTADCLANERIIDSLEQQINYYQDIEDLCHRTFTTYEQRLEVDHLMIANQKEQLKAKDDRNKATEDKCKQTVGKKNKQITGLTIGGTGLGLLAGLLVGIFAVK